jgi:hypothetical protein
MAEAVVPDRANEPAAPAEELPRFEQRRAVQGGRFMIGYLGIVVMAGAAIAGLALLSGTDNSPSAPDN